MFSKQIYYAFVFVEFVVIVESNIKENNTYKTKYIGLFGFVPLIQTFCYWKYNNLLPCF